jgi:hypothetical protein
MEKTMKRFLSVSLLMLCLSLPAFGGHTQAGGAYCECGTSGCVEDYPGECGRLHRDIEPSKSPSETSAELGILLVALLLWLRMKA